MRLRVLLGIFLVAPLAAQPITWVNQGGPPGGLVPIMHETSAGTLLAVDEIGRFGRSTGGGETWEVLDLAGINSFSESPGEVLAATASGVYRSTDDGQTWGQSSLAGVSVRQVARASTGDLFALRRMRGNDFLARSSDGGATWDSVATSTSIFLARGQDGNVYRSVGRSCSAFTLCQDLLRWDEAAARWDTLTISEHVKHGSVSGIDAQPDGTVYFATYGLGLLDMEIGGLSVLTPGEGWKGYGPYVTSLAVRPDGVFVGRLHDVYKLEGDALVKVAAIPAPVTTLAGRTTLFASTGTECYSVIDGTGHCDMPTGAYRINVSEGTAESLNFGQQFLYTLNEIHGSLLGVARSGLWIRPLACLTGGDYCELDPEWQWLGESPARSDLVRDVNITPWNSLLVSAAYWYGPGLFVQKEANGSEWMPFDRADFGWTAVGIGDSTILSLHDEFGGGAGLYRSTDRGETFEAVDFGDGISHALAEDFGLVLLGRTDGIYKSFDGLTWEHVFDSTPYGPVRAIEFVPDGDVVLRVALAGRYVVFGNGGRWEVVDSLPPTMSIGDQDTRAVLSRGLVQVGDTLWSQNGDGTWTGSAIPAGEAYGGRAATVAGDGYLYVRTRRGVLRSMEPIFVAADSEELPAQPSAFVVAPNPASGIVQITPGAAEGRIEVFDLLGRRVALVAEGAVPDAISWDTSALPAGLYFVRLTTPARTETAVLVVVR